MKLKIAVIALLMATSLTGCGITDLARQAADATACKALDSTISAITASYETGIVDSGFITKLDTLVGNQARSLLSTGLAEDLNSLTTALGDTNSAASSKENIAKITGSISQRCSDAGVNGIGG